MPKVKRSNQPAPAGRFPPALEWISAAAFAVVAGFLLIQKIDNPDLFFHLALGREFLASGWQLDLSAIYFTPVSGNWQGEFRQSFVGDVIQFLVASSTGWIGIQTFFIILTLGGFFFLIAPYLRSPKRDNVVLGIVLIFYLIGTLQLQIPRNAAFALGFLPLVLSAVDGALLRNGVWRMLLVPAVFGLWSTIHGSYLYGLVLAAAMAGGHCLDRASLGWRPFRRTAILALALLISSIGIASIQNPAMTTYLRMPLDQWRATFAFAPENPPIPVNPTASPGPTGSHSVSPPASALPNPTPVSGGFGRILEALKYPIWKPVPGYPSSGDFIASWNALTFLPVPVGLGFVFAVLGCLLLRSSRDWSLILPLVLAAYFGTVYVRGVGLAVIVALWAVVRSGVLDSIAPGRGIRAGVMAVIVVIIGLFSSQVAEKRWGDFVGESLREFGWGTIPLFDDRVLDAYLAEKSLKRPLTTVMTGSFAVYRGHPAFIDAFFPAHPRPVWQGYWQALRQRNLAILENDFAIDSALIETIHAEWIDVFLADSRWFPVFIGTGMIVFAPMNPSGTPRVGEVLFDASDLDRMGGGVSRLSAAVVALRVEQMYESRGLWHLARQYRDANRDVLDTAAGILHAP